VELAGVLVDQIDLDAAVERMRAFLHSGSAHQIATVNLDFLKIAERNTAFRAAINQADLAVADGMPLVWASRLKGQPLPRRITGFDLVLEACRLAAETGGGVFLLGAAPGVADAAARALEARFPGLRIAGTYSPPFGDLSAEENETILRLIRESSPSVVFTALGAPRQDLWIRDNLDRLETRVAMGVGCVFDVLVGNMKRAPQWMQRTGLEWSFRLAQEPKRLWRRYVVNDMPMFGRLVLSSVAANGAQVAGVAPSPPAA
jgi:N-acetylglucosaminyldiphosphoundecaprenol N-acetyl-beta-D-mannosaminyltransferase